MKHNHRIVPGHMGGEYVEGNVINVEVIKCNTQTANHAMWHYANWVLWGKRQDYLAWKGLSGCFSQEEIIEERLKMRGKDLGVFTVDNKIGLFDPVNRDKVLKGNSKGGKKGGIIANQQRWKSTVDGYVSTAAGVAHHNRGMGCDPGDRIRVG